MRISKTIDAPAHVVWRIFIDTSLWPKWGATVQDVALPTRYVRAGSRGKVKLTLGPWVGFKVTTFEEGRRWGWRVLGVPATMHEVEPLGEARCRASFTLPLIAAPYALVCKLALNAIAKMAAEAHHDNQALAP